jgi:hypothetical protein
MCKNCAFADVDRPSEKEQCKICIRNPKNLSHRFKPTTFNGEQIDKPIDMYVSKEFWSLLMKIIEKMQKSKPIYPPHPWITYYPSPWPNTTSSTTYYISIPTSVPLESRKERKRK